MVVVLALCVALCLSQTTTFGQPDSGGVTADSLRARAGVLMREWEAEWRASDSLRITAMHKRMKADSILRSIKTLTAAQPSAGAGANTVQPGVPDTTDIILATLQMQAASRMAAQKLAEAPVKRGQTLADTVTLEVLRMDADTGVASYYAGKFHGNKTSSGATFNMNDLTCAHRWLPFGTRLRVTNIENGRSVVVTVTDRGPFKHGRIIDVSKGAAQALDMIRKGTATVAIQIHEEAAPAPDTSASTVEPSTPDSE